MTHSITTICHYAECRYGECHDLFIVMLNVIMLSVIMLDVVAPANGDKHPSLFTMLPNKLQPQKVL
jgi:hypothetical protein